VHGWQVVYELAVAYLLNFPIVAIGPYPV